MNRLHHIMKTLPANMAFNRSYRKLEFVILDYNSGDRLEDWINESFADEILEGKLVFARTAGPDHFDWSRSKNMAFHLATGEIVCNVDADNFTGPGFATFINNHFQANSNSFLSVNFLDNLNNFSDTFGRIACLKEDFEATGGFDERMVGYGYEDIDFCQRLVFLGRKQHFITNKKYLETIRHGYGESFNYARQVLNTKAVFINYLSPFKSRVLFLFKDDRCAFGTLIDENEGMGNPTIEEGRWLSGQYSAGRNDSLSVHLPSRSIMLTDRDGHFITCQGDVFYKITDKTFLEKLEMSYSIIGNHQLFVNNRKARKVTVNTA